MKSDTPFPKNILLNFRADAFDYLWGVVLTGHLKVLFAMPNFPLGKGGGYIIIYNIKYNSKYYLLFN